MAYMSNMSSEAAKPFPRIILVGLRADDPVVPDHIRLQLDSLDSQMRDDGIDFTHFGTSPADGSSKVRHELASTPVDGVVIGRGIRCPVENAAWLEDILQCVRECAPNARIMFNTVPADTIDAIRRWFPG